MSAEAVFLAAPRRLAEPDAFLLHYARLTELGLEGSADLYHPCQTYVQSGAGGLQSVVDFCVQREQRWTELLDRQVDALPQ